MEEKGATNNPSSQLGSNNKEEIIQDDESGANRR